MGLLPRSSKTKAAKKEVKSKKSRLGRPLRHLARDARWFYFEHRMYAVVFVALLVVGGGYVFQRSLAQEACDAPSGNPSLCFFPNTYSDYKLPPAPGGYHTLEWDLTINTDPPLGPGYFWSTGFGMEPTPTDEGNGGYAGLQRGTDGRKGVIMAIWNTTWAVAATGGNRALVTNEPPNEAWNVTMPYAWQAGRKYHFKLTKYYVPPEVTIAGGPPYGTYIQAYITDTTSGVETYYGMIKLRDGLTGIGSNRGGQVNVGNFTELFAASPPITACNQVPFTSATFGPPRGNGGSYGLLRFPTYANIRYQTGRPNCGAVHDVAILGDGSFRHNVGWGANRIHNTTINPGPGPVTPPPLPPTNPPPPPPPPTCRNGRLVQPHLYCDDGGWWIEYTTTFAGRQFEYWKNGYGECGMKFIDGIGAAPAGYFFPADCSNIATLKQWEQARLINELGKKVFPIQDVGSARSANAPKPINTDANYGRFQASRGNLRTWADWEKPYRVSAPYDFVRWFIPNPHGLYNVNSKDYNFFGNIWGFVDGQYVAATNMGAYGKNVGVNQAFLFGPHENPGGNIAASFNGGKVMKVCWTIKDIWAAETGNKNHSSIRLRVTSNGGGVDWTNHPYTIFGLSGTGFKQYCHDNIRPPAGVNVNNLEYPVTYINGSVAVSQIERWIYWPDKAYEIALPSYGTFAPKDPLIRQSNVPSRELVAGQCRGVPYMGTLAKGCKITATSSLGVTSAVFGAKKKQGSKQVCVVAKVPANQNIFVHLYKPANSTPAAYTLTLKSYLWDLSGRGLYCAQTNVNEFQRLVLSSNVPSTGEPAVIESVTVN